MPSGFERYVPTDRQAQRALQQAMAALERAYPRVELKPKRDPLDELLLTILSQATSDTNSLRAFANLVKAFPDPRAMLDCDPAVIEQAIAVGGLGKVKSVRIQQVLHEVMARVRATFPDDTPEDLLDLRFLGDWPLDDARAFLTSLGGVGEKTAACVLAFSFHREGFPVDTHVHRLLRRLGIIPERMSAEKAHQRMYELTQPEERYALHVRMIQFGREVCRAQRPECSRCLLRKTCVFYKQEVVTGLVPAK